MRPLVIPDFLRQLFIGAALAWVLVGCSSNEPFEEPAPVPDVVSTVELEREWRVSVGDGHDDQLLYLQPLNTGDKLYAVSADGEMLAVSSDDGKVLWEKDLDVNVMAGLAGDREHLYLVTRNASLQAYNRENGKLRWEAPLPNEALARPGTNGQLVVAQTIDGKVLAFDASNGEKVWQYDAAVPVLTLRAASSPLVASDAVLISLANGRVMALSASSGQPAWQYQVSVPEGRTELERLVDVTAEPLVLETAALVVGYQGKLAMVDIRNGQEIWSRSGVSSLHMPALDQGSIYIARSNGEVKAYRGQDRRELWTQDALAWRQPTQPMAVGDHLLVGDFEGYIHILSQEDGSLQGQLHFDSDGLRVPFQRLQDGRILVFGNSGRMAAFELRQRD